MGKRLEKEKKNSGTIGNTQTGLKTKYGGFLFSLNLYLF